ncbi:excalibur calcium-binding domain-containing protein [Pseudonocardia humida]|uniref:Excalibur calcium-binding domain-containing protein n=1 Tax=Pseudonocardia humida TaxID=2800819 RepID=A0ABT0ZWJ4_9PSEU|nr:excalibur calcium-binding domain-containing protein [Pseudonocardia humida]MCO1655096.1 excalibur calcium-binding domain-containing protein [Pseudonocardia humida]
MPFVPLSSDGVQRATTEALPAPRIQVALEPHEGGITVLAVEPTGLRAIGQLDPTAAEPYRRVLAPLAEEGVYGTCTAEAAVTGTVLNLAPAEACLPEGGRAPAEEDDAAPKGATARTGRLREEADDVETGASLAVVAATTVRAPAGSTVDTVVLDPGAATRPGRRHDPRGRPAHRRRSSRAAGGGAGPVRMLLAGVTGLLLVGATAQGLTGGQPTGGSAVTAAPSPVSVPTRTAPEAVPVTVSVVPGAKVGADGPAPDRAGAASPPAAGAPADEDEPADEQGGSDHESDEGADEDRSDNGDTEDGDHSGSDADEGSDDSDDGESDGGRSDGGSDGGRSDGGSDGGSDDDEPDGRPDRGGGGGGGGGGGSFRVCLAAWADGKTSIRRGEPGYSRRLDLDGDGRACERR